MSAFPHEQESVALDQASCRAMDLIYEFSELDPNDASDENPWRDPNKMYAQLDLARSEVVEAAQTLKQAVAKNIQSNEMPSYQEDLLRAQFMDMITDAFADVLQNMKEHEDVDVDILADCLQSGIDILSQEDRELLMHDMDVAGEDDPDAEETDNTTTPHEARRRELGYVQATA